MKMKKKTETEAFQKLTKGNFRKIKEKDNCQAVKKSQIKGTTIMQTMKIIKKTFVLLEMALLKN